MSANYFILNTFLVAASNAKRFKNFSIVELDSLREFHKKQRAYESFFFLQDTREGLH